MKRITVFALVVILSLSLVACGRRKNDKNDNVTTDPTKDTVVTTPTVETNIPDTEVNDNSTVDSTETTDNSDDLIPDGVTDPTTTDATEAR